MPAARIPVIEYHYSTYRLTDEIYMTSGWFEDQMSWLAENGYHTLTANELVQFLDGGPVPAPAAVLTFDIGTEHRDDYVNVIIPALRRNHLHALIFVVTGMISDSCADPAVECWDELRQWAAEGLIDVESHGVNHPDYATLAAADQRFDAGAAKTLIEEKIGRPVAGFAFPYDSFTAGATKVIQSLGYQFAFGGNTRADRSIIPADSDRFSLPRIYPYSNPKIYPVIYGSQGMTFDRLVETNSAPAAGAPAANTPAPASDTATPAPAGYSLAKYYLNCLNANAVLGPMDHLYALSQLSFPPDLSADAQSLLAQPIILRPSCNVERGNQPRAIILHATRGELAPTISEFQRPANTSVHYIIDRDGQVYQMVPEGLAAYHVSCGDNRTMCVASCPICNSADGAFRQPYLQSVGIELVNLGQMANPAGFGGLVYEDYLMSFNYRFWEDYPDAQLASLRILVEDIRNRWGIPYSMVMGHYRINEKSDPGPALNLLWARNGNPPRPPIFNQMEP
jgi:N-acetyl-anhydromuramyl-L-alanine amidase AmpD/peptidoglycan/xylan/chitin deacetylase (PgdA/CDA1 family)